MSKRIFQAITYTPTATADTTNLATGTFQAIGAALATTGLQVIEIYEGGQASASSINIMVFARDSTLGASLQALPATTADGPMGSLTSNLATAPLVFTGAGTPPQRSAITTTAKLNLSFNAFGGIVRWVAAPGEEWQIVGISVNLSESSLSAFTGGSAGLIGSHIVYEPF